MTFIVEIFQHAVMITGFVFVMMLVIEYFNVQSRGMLAKHASTSNYWKYIFAALMGVIPGCLGAFVIVALYSHRMTSAGAVVTAMVATSGDEAFVMLSLFPGEALILMGLLFVVGIAAGLFTDVMLKSITALYPVIPEKAFPEKETCNGFKIHESETVQLFTTGGLTSQWKSSCPERIILLIILILWIFSVATGQTGPGEWNWIRVSILLVSGMALFIVFTVPGHFLTGHLWNHVARKHVPGIFIWTFSALFFIHLLVDHLHWEHLITHNPWIMMILSSFIGLIPQSGPHLLFVTLFAQGTIPFSILLVNSIVQDGHGMLPLLSHSPRTFVFIKLINLLAGLSAGILILSFIHFFFKLILFQFDTSNRARTAAASSPVWR